LVDSARLHSHRPSAVMAVSLSARCLRNVALFACKEDQNSLPPTASTPRLLGSKSPTMSKTPKTPGMQQSSFGFVDAEDDKVLANEVASPPVFAVASPMRSSGRRRLATPLSSPAGCPGGPDRSPLRSPLRPPALHALCASPGGALLSRFAAAAALELPKEVHQPVVPASAPAASDGQLAYPVMLGRLGAFAQEGLAQKPSAEPETVAPISTAAASAYGRFPDGVGSAPEQARLAFLARRGRMEGRTQVGVIDTKPSITHAAHATREYPVLLGKETKGATVDTKQNSLEPTNLSPAALARANFLARRERIGSRRLTELGA